MLDVTDVPIEASYSVLFLRIALELLLRIKFELPLPRIALAHDREVVKSEHDVLRRHDNRRAVGWMQNVVRRHHEDARFELRLERQRDVHGHLIAVKIGVERGADERVQLDRLALDQYRLERLDAETMQRRRAIEQNRMLANDFVKNIPNLGLFLLDELLRLFDRGG